MHIHFLHQTVHEQSACKIHKKFSLNFLKLRLHEQSACMSKIFNFSLLKTNMSKVHETFINLIFTHSSKQLVKLCSTSNEYVIACHKNLSYSLTFNTFSPTKALHEKNDNCA